jgi:hypothetical protein
MKAIAMTIFACGLIGCMADDPAPTAKTDPATDQVTLDNELPQDMPADRPAQSSLTADDLGNVPNTVDVAAVNCVFIDWCNEPGGNGTICVIRSGCHPNGCIVTSAITQECVDDYHAVCGKGNPIQPALYRCQ